MMTGGERKVIVIKKKKKGGHGGHHGGSWKVAYADFVTAMMAFNSYIFHRYGDFLFLCCGIDIFSLIL